jgi:GntR family transcriptional regulator
MTTVSRNSPLPLYAQIKGVLQHEIEASMAPGDMLPIEPELEKRFGVNRITVRNALDALETEGLIVCLPGKVSLCANPPSPMSWFNRCPGPTPCGN